MDPFQILLDNDEAWKIIDHRVDGWPFMSSMLPVFFLVILAISVVLFGPIYMKTRQPLNIGPIMALFNIFIVIFNIYIASQLWIGSSRKLYNWVCQPIDSNATDIEEMRIVKAMYLLFICKLMELFDTFFLIARKKSIGQNTYMVLHHAAMAGGAWVIVRWSPSGSVFAPAAFNAITHAVMYAYFFFIIFLPNAIKSPIIKTTFSTFLVVQLLVYLFYALIVIWVQCPHTLAFAYIGLALILGMVIYQLIAFLFDYQRATKGEGIMSYVIKLLKEHEGENFKLK